MPDQSVHLLLVPGFADWEPAHAVAELRRNGQVRIVTVGLGPGRQPVESMGGLRVEPDLTLAEVNPADVALLILPGGDYWEEQRLPVELTGLLQALDQRGVPIAAICGATLAVARAGLLDGRRHTSNGLAYLRAQVPEYRAAVQYVDAPAVRDRGLITANGLADVEFAAEIMAQLEVLSPEDRAQWTELFRSGRLPAEQ